MLKTRLSLYIKRYPSHTCCARVCSSYKEALCWKLTVLNSLLGHRGHPSPQGTWVQWKTPNSLCGCSSTEVIDAAWMQSNETSEYMIDLISQEVGACRDLSKVLRSLAPVTPSSLHFLPVKLSGICLLDCKSSVMQPYCSPTLVTLYHSLCRLA